MYKENGRGLNGDEDTANQQKNLAGIMEKLHLNGVIQLMEIPTYQPTYVLEQSYPSVGNEG